jgi:hypothetical protein
VGVVLAENAVLAEKAVDADIEDILDRISFKDTRAYQLGYADGQKRIIDIAMSNIKNQMAGPAELFYHMLQRIIPKEDILQHRIGTDYTTGVPTSLTVIAHKHVDKMREIRYMARDIELYLFHEHTIDCQFWTKTDANLEQSLVDQDFPFCRRDV